MKNKKLHRAVGTHCWNIANLCDGLVEEIEILEDENFNLKQALLNAQKMIKQYENKK